MKPTALYLILCIVGVIVPNLEFVPWVAVHGLNLPLFVRELFATRIGAFFGMDVLMSAVALIAFTRIEGKRIGLRNRWLVIVALLCVGVSLALPLFLYLREVELEQRAIPGS